MSDRAGLVRRLGELARSRRVAVPPAGREADRPSPVAPAGSGGGPATLRGRWDRRASAAETILERAAGVEDFLPGGEWADARGAVFVHERLRSELERPRPHWGRLGVPPPDEPDLAAVAERGLGRVLFLDLETGGLASSPVFLAGTMHWNGADYVLRQYFARHYGEEGPLLRALGEMARDFEFLVTYNGKSYDAPFLATRAVIHGERLALPPRHVDLLHPVRRRWKRRLPDCRLQTLESLVCRRRRSGDVPSDEVPALYHDFVRRGDPHRLIPVFHHNLLDVITMAEVLRALCAPAPTDARTARAAPPGAPAGEGPGPHRASLAAPAIT